jgi:hypothetical protein
MGPWDFGETESAEVFFVAYQGLATMDADGWEDDV